MAKCVKCGKELFPEEIAEITEDDKFYCQKCWEKYEQNLWAHNR